LFAAKRGSSSSNSSSRNSNRNNSSNSRHSNHRSSRRRRSSRHNCSYSTSSSSNNSTPPGTGLLLLPDHRDFDPNCESSDSERLKEKRKKPRRCTRIVATSLLTRFRLFAEVKRRNVNEDTSVGEDFRGMTAARHPQKHALLLCGGVVKAVESIPFVYFILTRR